MYIKNIFLLIYHNLVPKKTETSFQYIFWGLCEQSNNYCQWIKINNYVNNIIPLKTTDMVNNYEAAPIIVKCIVCVLADACCSASMLYERLEVHWDWHLTWQSPSTVTGLLLQEWRIRTVTTNNKLKLPLHYFVLVTYWL